MRGADLFAVDPLRIRSLSLRKRSLLRKHAPTSSSSASRSSFDDSTVSEKAILASARCVVKPKKQQQQRKGRRVLRFAPMVDVYEATLPDDCADIDAGELWLGRLEYERCKKEFTEVIMAIQTEDLDFADLLLEEKDLPHDHPFRKYCMRGCEKYFDLHTRFRIRQVIVDKVLEFYHEVSDDPEAVRVFCEALSAECSDLAYFHGKLNSLQCWGTTLERYKLFHERFLRSFESCNEEERTSYGVEVILRGGKDIVL